MFNFVDQVSRVSGWLTKEEGDYLYESAKRIPKSGKIVEIGSWKGRSTICLAKGCQDGNQTKVYAIDPHNSNSSEIIKKLGRNDTYDQFLANIQTAGVRKWINSIRETSENSVSKIESPIHLLFIDGSHAYRDVKKDCDLWFPKLINGGQVIFHDCWHAPGVHVFTSLLLLTSSRVRAPKLLDTMTILEKVEKNSSVDRAINLGFIIYRAIIGWMGTLKIDHFGTVYENKK